MTWGLIYTIFFGAAGRCWPRRGARAGLSWARDLFERERESRYRRSALARFPLKVYKVIDIQCEHMKCRACFSVYGNPAEASCCTPSAALDFVPVSRIV